MKRCPQCEFIYEDDQNLCDMDGVLLVLDSRSLPNLHALVTVPEVPGKASARGNAAARRNRMVPAFATILLTLVIASFYYFGTPRNVAPANNVSQPNVTVPPAPTPELPQVQPPVAEEPAPAEAAKPTETKPAAPEKPAAAPAKKTSTKPAAINPVKHAEPKKDDSKVGSILKKTGKILKKPFRF